MGKVFGGFFLGASLWTLRTIYVEIPECQVQGGILSKMMFRFNISRTVKNYTEPQKELGVELKETVS
jgi:hypothetical protein